MHFVTPISRGSGPGFHIVKVCVVLLISALVGYVLSTGRLYGIVILGLISSIVMFLFCLHQSYANLIRFMIVALFFAPFHYLSFLNIFNAINPLTFLGSVLMTKTFLDKVTMNKGPWFRGLTNIDRIYFFFLCSAMVSTFFAKSTLGALNWIFYSIIVGYMPFKVITYIEKFELTKVIRTLVILGALCALEGIGEYFLKYSILLPPFSGRLTSLLGHPLVNGMMFSILFPYSLFLYSRTKEKKFIGCATIFLIAIILAQSRGSWIALASGLFFVLLMAPVKVKIRMIIAIVLVSAIISTIPLFRNTIFSRASRYEGDQYSSRNIRLKSIPVALAILKDKPLFGGGPFNAGRYKDEYATDSTLRKTAFENSYLGLLVDFGIVGCLLLFSIFIFSFSRTMLAVNRFRHAPALYFVLWSLVVMFMNMGTFNFDSYRTFSFVVWLFTGLAFALTSLEVNVMKSEIS